MDFNNRRRSSRNHSNSDNEPEKKDPKRDSNHRKRKSGKSKHQPKNKKQKLVKIKIEPEWDPNYGKHIATAKTTDTGHRQNVNEVPVQSSVGNPGFIKQEVLDDEEPIVTNQYHSQNGNSGQNSAIFDDSLIFRNLTNYHYAQLANQNSDPNQGTLHPETANQNLPTAQPTVNNSVPIDDQRPTCSRYLENPPPAIPSRSFQVNINPNLSNPVPESSSPNLHAEAAIGSPMERIVTIEQMNRAIAERIQGFQETFGSVSLVRDEFGEMRPLARNSNDLNSTNCNPRESWLFKSNVGTQNIVEDTEGNNYCFQIKRKYVSYSGGEIKWPKPEPTHPQFPIVPFTYAPVVPHLRLNVPQEPTSNPINSSEQPNFPTSSTGVRERVNQDGPELSMEESARNFRNQNSAQFSEAQQQDAGWNSNASYSMTSTRNGGSTQVWPKQEPTSPQSPNVPLLHTPDNSRRGFNVTDELNPGTSNSMRQSNFATSSTRMRETVNQDGPVLSVEELARTFRNQNSAQLSRAQQDAGWNSNASYSMASARNGGSTQVWPKQEPTSFESPNAPFNCFPVNSRRGFYATDDVNPDANNSMLQSHSNSTDRVGRAIPVEEPEDSEASTRNEVFSQFFCDLSLDEEARYNASEAVFTEFFNNRSNNGIRVQRLGPHVSVELNDVNEESQLWLAENSYATVYQPLSPPDPSFASDEFSYLL